MWVAGSRIASGMKQKGVGTIAVIKTCAVVSKLLIVPTVLSLP